MNRLPQSVFAGPVWEHLSPMNRLPQCVFVGSYNASSQGPCGSRFSGDALAYNRNTSTTRASSPAWSSRLFAAAAASSTNAEFCCVESSIRDTA